MAGEKRKTNDEVNVEEEERRGKDWWIESGKEIVEHGGNSGKESDEVMGKGRIRRACRGVSREGTFHRRVKKWAGMRTGMEGEGNSDRKTRYVAEEKTRN